MPGEVWTAILVLVLAGIAFLAVRSYVKKLRHGCCTGGDGPEKRLKVADNRPEHYPYQLTLSIDGMTCKNCAVRVENALNRIDGVWATVDFPQNRALVRMKTPVDEEALRAAVWKSGYVAVRKNPPG